MSGHSIGIQTNMNLKNRIVGVRIQIPVNSSTNSIRLDRVGGVEILTDSFGRSTRIKGLEPSSKR